MVISDTKVENNLFVSRYRVERQKLRYRIYWRQKVQR